MSTIEAERDRLFRAWTKELGFSTHKEPKDLLGWDWVFKTGPYTVVKELSWDEHIFYRSLLGKKYKYLAQVYDMQEFSFVGEYSWYACVEYIPGRVPHTLGQAIDTLHTEATGSWPTQPWGELKKLLNKKEVALAKKYKVPELIKCFQRNGVVPNDLHSGNIATKNGHVVAFDVVYEYPSGKKAQREAAKCLKAAISSYWAP